MSDRIRGWELHVFASGLEWSKQLRSYARNKRTGIQTFEELDPAAVYDVLTGDHAPVAVVVDATATWLNAARVSEFRSSGALVYGIVDVDKPATRDRLERAGIEVSAKSTDKPADIIDDIEERLACRVEEASAFASITQSYSESDRDLGTHTAVVPVVGGAGSVEVAISLVDCLNELGRAVGLADGDVAEPVLGLRLNLDPARNIHSAIDAVMNRRGELGDSIQHVSTHKGRVPVLAGSPSQTDWVKLSSDHVLRTMRLFGGEVGHLFVPTARLRPASRVPVDAGDGYAITTTLVKEASSIVAVTEMSRRGARALINWIAMYESLSRDNDGLRAVHVVFNREPTDSRDFVREQLVGEVRAIVGDVDEIATISYLPYDPAVADAEYRAIVSRPRSEFRSATKALARRLAASTTSERGRSRESEPDQKPSRRFFPRRKAS